MDNNPQWSGINSWASALFSTPAVRGDWVMATQGRIALFILIIVTYEDMVSRSSQLYTQLKQLSNQSLKKTFRLERDSNPWPLWYRCSALPTELTSQLRAGQVVRVTCNILQCDHLNQATKGKTNQSKCKLTGRFLVSASNRGLFDTNL